MTATMTLLAAGVTAAVVTALCLCVLGQRSGRRQRATTRAALTPAVGVAPPPPPAADDPPGPWDDPATARALATQRLRTTHPGAMLEALAPLVGTTDPYWADLTRQAASDWAAVNAEEPHPAGTPRIGRYLDPGAPARPHRHRRPTLRDRLRHGGPR